MTIPKNIKADPTAIKMTVGPTLPAGGKALGEAPLVAPLWAKTGRGDEVREKTLEKREIAILNIFSLE